MHSISRQSLEDKMKSPQDFALVEVLPPREFDKFHLPGALNIPLGDDFEARFQHAIPDRNRHIVVYCKDASCQASPEAAKRLDALGYRHVFDYAEGKEDWLDAGLATVAS